MKIIGLLGSPRGKKSNTLKLLESALQGAADAGAGVEIIDITHKNINYCIGCEKCYETGKCFREDDHHEVFDKVLEADGLIMASPVYFNSVSAQLKTFMDRTPYHRHCLSLIGKYGMAVVTTASSGAPGTADLISGYLVDLGAFSIGSTCVALPVLPANLEAGRNRAYAMGKDLVDAIATGRQYPEQKTTQDVFIRNFKFVVKYNKEKWKAKYEHYEAKKWL
jgi:multimeric flavodoxin WrbA